MQVGKVNIYSTNTTNKYNKVPTFTRKLQPQEEADYNKNAIGAALDYLGTQSLAMILHGSCNPVTENDLGIGSPCNEKAKDVIALERLHGFNANQLGPMGEITRGDISPYSASVFALNRMFIDAEALTQDRYANIIPEEELKTLRVKYSDTPGGYTYSKFFDSFENYDRVIKDAYTNFRTKVRAKDPNALALLDEYNEFKSKKRNRAIMSAIFEVLSNTYGTRDVSAWESEIDRNLPVLLKNKDKEAIERYRQITKRSADDINSYIFGQFLINKQLKENKIYRDSIGFEYINDNLVGNDKSEVWMYPEVFLEKYRNDDYSAIKYFNRAIRLAPNKQIYKSNLNKILKKLEAKSRRRHMIFVIFLACLMFWLGYNGYSNFANIVPLFLLAQIILNSQRNYTKNLINEEVSHI